MCNARKTAFTRVIVALILLGHQNLHEQNKFYFPSFIIYYFLLAGHKVHFIAPCGIKQIHFSTPSWKTSCATREKLFLLV